MGYTHGTPADAKTKICTCCHKELPNTHEYFNYASKKKGTLSATCKECSRLKNINRNKIKRESNAHLIFKSLFYEGTKICSKCKRDLPNNYLYFVPDKTCKTGLRNICRECSSSHKHFLSEEYIPIQKWSIDELQILKNNYSKYTNEELHDKFFPNRSIRSIESQANVMGYSGKDIDTLNRSHAQQAEKISVLFKGRIMSEEMKQRLSKTKKEYYKTHESSWKGRIVSEEEKEKIRLRVKGRWSGNKNPRHINPLNGKDNGRWKGGILSLKTEFRSRISDWKNASMSFCNYKSVVTGKNFDHIHHTTSFTNILEECLKNTNIQIKSKIGDYTDEELILLEKEIQKLHIVYGYGACIEKNIHKLFHDNYGYTNFSPENFVEFLNDIDIGKYNKWFQSNNIEININYNYLSYLTTLCNSLKKVA